RKAVQLILGCVPLLIVAGIVEGFFSPAHLPPWIKFLVAILLLGLLLCYLLLPASHNKPRRFTSR
ncbi:MAG: stage II sporulation protein M, partial [Syntrophobacterales bacterium]